MARAAVEQYLQSRVDGVHHPWTVEKVWCLPGKNLSLAVQVGSQTDASKSWEKMLECRLWESDFPTRKYASFVEALPEMVSEAGLDAALVPVFAGYMAGVRQWQRCFASCSSRPSMGSWAGLAHDLHTVRDRMLQAGKNVGPVFVQPMVFTSSPLDDKSVPVDVRKQLAVVWDGKLRVDVLTKLFGGSTGLASVMRAEVEEVEAKLAKETSVKKSGKGVKTKPANTMSNPASKAVAGQAAKKKAAKQAAAKALPKAAKMSKKDVKAKRTEKAIGKPAAKKR
jgi:hypothetical protein